MTHKKHTNVPDKNLPKHPLTTEEIKQASEERVSRIATEFTEGFNFIKDYPRSVTFFGSARVTEDNQYYKKARSLSSRIVKELGYAVFTGGGPGIMEAANRGAFDADGQSLGLNIELPKEQRINPYVTDSVGFYYFFSRKVSLSFAAESYIFFPGGFGTMDEFFEILTLVQTHKIKPVPIILVGTDYWGALDQFIKAELLSRGTIDEEDSTLYTITDNEEEIIECVKNAPIKRAV